jgi:hypothetical protein
VSDILIDPENPNIIIACTGWGPYQGVSGDIWRSTDGGETWTRVSSVSAIWSDLAISARNPSTGVRYYYAVGHGIPGQPAALQRSRADLDRSLVAFWFWQPPFAARRNFAHQPQPRVCDVG